ncbi:hypothetical protein D3C75_871570 [compost metagenome]
MRHITEHHHRGCLADTLCIDPAIPYIGGEHRVWLLACVLHGIQIQKANESAVLPHLERLHAVIPDRQRFGLQHCTKQRLRQLLQRTDNSIQREVIAQRFGRKLAARSTPQVLEIPGLGFAQALLGSPTLHLRTPPQHGRSHMIGQIVEKAAHLGYRTRTLHLQALLQMAGITEQEGLLLK